MWAINIKGVETLTSKHEITKDEYQDLKSINNLRFEVLYNSGQTKDKLFRFEAEHKIVIQIVDHDGKKVQFYSHAYKEASNREQTSELELKRRLYHPDVPFFSWMDIGEDGFIRESYEAFLSKNNFYNPAIDKTKLDTGFLKLRMEIVNFKTGQTLAFDEFPLS